MNDELKIKIRNIQKNIKSLTYAELVVYLKEFESFLIKRLEKDPDDMDAICMLASVELEMRQGEEKAGEEKAIDLLKNYLNRMDTLSDQDRLRLYTNIAFYYFSDYKREEEFGYLKLALAIDENNAIINYALGLYYFDKNDYYHSEKCLKKACDRVDSFRNLFSYGVALFENKKYKDAKEIFNKLLAQYPNRQVIILHLAYCELRLGNEEIAIKMADELIHQKLLYDDIYDDAITYDEIGLIYYELEKYEKFCEIFQDKKKYPFSVANRFDYFYALYILGEMDQFNQIVNDELNELMLYLDNAKQDEVRADFSEEEKQEDILYAKNEIKSFVEEIDKIKTGLKPEAFYYMRPIYDCYLIDCIRHMKV